MKYIKFSSNNEIAVNPVVITNDSPILSVNRVSGVSSISRGGRKHKDSTLIRVVLDDKPLILKYFENDIIREKVGYLFPISITGPVGTTFRVDWGDGNTTDCSIVEASVIGIPDGWSVGEVVHEYLHGGTYNIEIYEVSNNYGLGGAFVNTSDSKSYIGNMFSMSKYITPAYYNDACGMFSTRVTDIIVSSQVSRLENRMLVGCYKLKHLYLDRPENITYVGDESIYNNCNLDLISTTLSQLLNQSSNTHIGHYAFSSSGTDYYNELTQIPLQIPGGATSVGKTAFMSALNRRFNKLYIPDSVATIESDSFTFGYFLTSIRIGETTNSELKVIRGGFSSCVDCRELTIWSNKLTIIGDSAFNKLLSCNTINIHTSVAPTLDVEVFNRAGELAVKRGETCVLHVPVGATGYDAWLTALGSNWSIAYDL